MGRNSKLVLQISIHALREERDDFVGFKIWATHRFQSTRSARSATKYKADQSGGKTNFNPRAPRGARPGSDAAAANPAEISIHALREERDGCFITKYDKRNISIHALREERDSKKTQNRRAFFVINIEYYESFR